MEFCISNHFGLVAYTNSDMVGFVDDRKITTSYVFFLGSGAILLCSNKQPTISLSSIEAEYIAPTTTTCEALWVKKVLLDLKQEQNHVTSIYCDNRSTIAITKKPMFHNRTKHIDTKYHFIRDYVAKQDIEIKFCKTNDELADIFTKALPKGKFQYMRDMLGIASLSIKWECLG